MSRALIQHRPAENMEHRQTTLTYTPRFDIWEDEEAFHLTGDMPGVTSEQLDIQFENQELRVWGKVIPRQTGEYLSQEYGVGDFYRSFSLGDEIDGQRIEAVLKDGVLELTLPKHPSVRPRRIEVKTG